MLETEHVPHTAVHQLCSRTERNYVMKFFGLYVQRGHPISYLFPLALLKPCHWWVPTKPCSSLQAEGPAEHAVYTARVHIIQQGPSPIMEIDDDPSSSQPLSAWAPCPSPYSWSCGGRDVSRAVTCFLIHCNITRHHKSLSLSFSFSVFIERIQCLENSWYYLMIFW